MRAPSPVVVTGLGAVSAAGAGADALATDFATSTVRTAEVDRSGGYHRDRGSRRAVLVGAVDLTRWLAPMASRRMSPASRWAVAASNMAVDQAGVGTEKGERTAVVASNAYGAAVVTEKILCQIFLEGPEAVSPALFTESVANAPAAQVALALGARGPNLTFTQRQAGPLIALAQAAALLGRGAADLAVVATVDEVSPVLHAVLDRFRALAPSSGPDGDEVARPFDRRRDGCLVGEGAAVMVLEPETAARARSARMLARVLAAGSAFDPTASRTGWGRNPSGLADTLSLQLGRLGLTTSDLDLVVSGASGIPTHDRYEALLLRELWAGRPLPTTLAPRAVTGETGVGLLAAAVLAAGGAPFGATPGFAEPDPELGLIPHDGRRLPPPRRLLALSTAVGGAAAWAVLEAVSS